MPPIVEQLSFELPEPANDRLEQLLAKELAREVADRSYGLTLIQIDGEELGDAA